MSENSATVAKPRFFKETAKSVRTYLLFVGVVGGLIDLANLADSGAEPSWIPFHLMGALVAIAIVYCGVRLHEQLATNPGTVRKTLYAKIAVTIVSGGVMAAAEIMYLWMWIWLGASIALALYLVANVNRLAAEVQGTPTTRIAAQS